MEYLNLKKIKFNELALEAAHDIRAPLTALRTIEENTHDLPENTQRILHAAIDRISAIADKLLAANRELALPQIEKVDLGKTLKIAVEEIKVTHKEIQFEIAPDHGSTQVLANEKDLLQVLSNIIINAYEACEHQPEIEIQIKVNRHTTSVTIKDNGRGFPKSLRRLLGKRQFTFGKAFGNGCGLYLAHKKVSGWGGSISIGSKQGKGTRVTINLLNANKSR